MPEPLTSEEKQQLLRLARQAIEDTVRGNPLLPIDLSEFPARLREQGVTFVTLTADGELRGCVGAMEAYQPLVEDVREHAVAAALNDYRFFPVEPDEVPRLHIEISRLTAPEPLEYGSPEDLIHCLQPGIDGVLIKDGLRRATFLPQVWEKIPDPSDFLDHLCLKMGASANLWRCKPLRVFVYQVEEFHEEPPLRLSPIL